jgi:hypothetical protein
MATYQNFKNDLLAQLASSDDADLVEMTERLLDYTDGLINTYTSGNPPPIIDLTSPSRGMDGFGLTADVDPPPIIDTKSPSKISDNSSNGVS